MSNDECFGAAISVFDGRIISQQDSSFRSHRNTLALGGDDLNLGTMRNLRLAKLILAEFDDVKRIYSTYLNIVMIGSGFRLAFSITAIQHSTTSVLLFLCLAATIFGASVPILFVSTYSIFVDRQVSPCQQPSDTFLPTCGLLTFSSSLFALVQGAAKDDEFNHLQR